MSEPTQAHSAALDGEGYLVDPEDWDEALAVQLAQAQGIELQDDHWLVIRFMREYYAEHQICADARHAMKQLDSDIRGVAGSACSNSFPTATWRRPAASPACAGHAPGARVDDGGAAAGRRRAGACRGCSRRRTGSASSAPR